MSTGQPTEREAALLARIQELEADAHKTSLSVAQGGVFESLWRTATSIISPWLVAIAVAAVLAHHGFGYFIDGQIQQAQTQQAQAKADLTAALAKAENEPANGEISRKLATAKAEIGKLQADALGARASAQAMIATLNGETMALQTAKAQLDKTRNEATALQAQAEADSARFGLLTLQQRAVRAGLIIQQLKTVDAKVQALVNHAAGQVTSQSMGDQISAALTGHTTNSIMGAMLRGECVDNPYAALIACPASYVRNAPPDPAAAPPRPKLGVEVKTGNGGVQITRVIPNTPAAAADLTSDYTIKALDGVKMETAEQFVAAIQNHSSGQTIKLTAMICIIGCNDPKTITVTLQ